MRLQRRVSEVITSWETKQFYAKARWPWGLKGRLKGGLEKIGGQENETLYPIDSFLLYCFMITCCIFGAIKFCQLEVQCNFPVYSTSCVKYKLIVL